MDNNLKTLKDIEFEYEARVIVESDDLRKLAKQQIQAIQLAKDKTTNIADMIIADRKIEWIKYFFNLKEVNNVE